MLLITENAETEFLDHLKDIKDAGSLSEWKCIICGLEAKMHNTPEKREDLCRMLKMSDLSNREGTIFWLHTGHIIVLVQSAIEPVFKTLSSLIQMYVNRDGKSLIPPRIINLSKDVERLERAITKPITAEVQIRAEAERNKPVGKIPTEKKRKQIGTMERRATRRERFKPTMLTIEDDRSTQRIISAMMSAYCDVVTARNAEEAVEQYEATLPNIVFMDIELPDGNGKELTKRFFEADDEAFIVMVSGKADLQDVDECIMAGARGFITKDPKTMQNRMLYFVNLYNSERRTGKSAAGKRPAKSAIHADNAK